MDVLELILVILLLSWFAGVAFSVGGSFIHLLLLIALIIFIVRMGKGGGF